MPKIHTAGSTSMFTLCSILTLFDDDVEVYSTQKTRQAGEKVHDLSRSGSYNFQDR